MKITINKGAKRVLSLVLAVAMLIGTLFTANIGVNIKTQAATLNIKYWDNSSTVSKQTDLDGDGTVDKPYLIKSVADFAFVATGADGSTKDEYYKIDDGIDALVLQPETYGAAIMALDSADNVKTYFETNKSSLKTWVNETAAAASGFNGYFDGNGAIIAGMYSTTGSLGLFTNLNSSTIENVIIKNNYASGDSAAIICSNSKDSGAVFNFNKCELFNNVVISTRLNDGSANYGGLLLAQTTKAFINIDNCIIYGNITTHSQSTDYWYYETSDSTSKTSTVVSGYDVTYGLWGTVAGNSDNGGSGNNTVSDSLILDTFPHAVSWDYNGTYYTTYDNVYTNMTGKTIVNTIKGATGASATGANWTELTLTETIFTITSPINANGLYDLAVKKGESNCVALDYTIAAVDSEGAKGSLGKLAMDMDWAVDGDTENGKWYATDGEYPTLFKPEGWKDCETIKVWSGQSADFTTGTGTEENPYLIETPEQLWKMVVDGGKVDGKPAYYKVKDGVENLYLSKAISGGYAAAKACTDYKNWNPNTWTAFEGNFDGNGVTIRGMISKSTDGFKQVGLVGVFGEDAVVKNVNFDTCYAHNTHANNSALLASQIIYMGNEDADSEQTTETGGGKDGYNLIYNVSVRNSSIQSKNNSQCAGLVVSYNGYSDMLQAVNCLYDGYSCELGNGQSGNANAGIAAYSWGINNAQFSSCVSLGAPIASNRSGTDLNYNDYRTDKDGAQYTSATGAMSYNYHPVYTFNCYTDIKEAVNTTAVELVDENGTSIIKAATADETLVNNMPLLDWANGWYVATDADGRKVPMPRVRTAADVPATWDTGAAVLTYNVLLNAQFNGLGATMGSGPYNNGTFGFFYDFEGSGTKDDPYLISTPLELARAIGSGGININQKLHFKLASDIDISGMPWLDTVGCVLRQGTFAYVPFEGVLDGDGHTVTGLYAVSNDGAAGLIPELTSAGVVKNLHIRNSHIGSSAQYQPYKEVKDEFGTATEIDAENPVTNTNTAGAIAGITAAGAQIIGCSVENTTVLNSKNQLTADGNATVKNSYIDETYYNADGEKVNADQITVDYNGKNTEAVWYKGGLENSMPQLVNRAAAMTEVDVSGLGDADYNAADLSSLRNKLLRKSAYNYIYGDVNRDGSINSTDLVILRRAMIDDYEDLEDGFWRNVELGKIKIYYGENDNYDAARKLELYFESLYPGIDVQKIVSTSKGTTSGIDSDGTKVYLHEGTGTGDPNGTEDGYFDIIVGDVKNKSTAFTGNNYAITYENDTLWLQGANFTAVEQAVLDYVAKTVPNAQEGGYTVASATLDSYKVPVTVGDSTYYYAWGDEFSGINEDGTGLNFDNWLSGSQQSESQTGASYKNQEVGTVKSLEKLLVVDGGKLSMKRGHDSTLGASNNGSVALIEGEDYSVGGSNGYTTLGENDQYFSSGKIHTDSSMLFKQGYIEMKASVPADGHAFPAWWMMANPSGYTHRNDGWTQSLYSKVYKTNKKWNGTNQIDRSNLDTYKYQVPSAYYEIDIFEVMQTPSHVQQYVNNSGNYGTNYKTHNTAVGWYNMNGTIHKWYSNGVQNDKLYIADWDNYSFKTQGMNFDTFSGTSSDWTHRFKQTEHSFGGATAGSGNNKYYTTNPSNPDNVTARTKLQYERKYGFLWKATDTTFECTLYIYDTNADGDATTNDIVKLPITSDDRVLTNAVEEEWWGLITNPVYEDANAAIYGDSAYNSKLMNSYMYLILDNKFYSYNNSGDGVAYTDLVTNAVSDASTSFNIDYMRVYQLDGRRDIVTPETENFNNNNHFGYK